jgi:hypothetical protein
VLVVHAALPYETDDLSLDDAIMRVRRFREPPALGTASELLWGDPDLVSALAKERSDNPWQ